MEQVNLTERIMVPCPNPAHDDSDKSCTYYPAKNYFRCGGCGFTVGSRAWPIDRPNRLPYSIDIFGDRGSDCSRSLRVTFTSVFDVTPDELQKIIDSINWYPYQDWDLWLSNGGNPDGTGSMDDSDEVIIAWIEKKLLPAMVQATLIFNGISRGISPRGMYC